MTSPGTFDELDAGPGVVAVLLAGARATRHLPTLLSLRRAYPRLRVFAGASDPLDVARLVEAGAIARQADSIGQLANEVWEECRCHVLVLQATTLVPMGALDAGDRAARS